MFINSTYKGGICGISQGILPRQVGSPGCEGGCGELIATELGRGGSISAPGGPWVTGGPGGPGDPEVCTSV